RGRECRIGDYLALRCVRIIDRNGREKALPAGELRERDVAYDRQPPGPRAAAGIAIDVPDHSEKGVMDRIFGFVAAAQQPAGQVVGGVEMRQDQSLRLL